MTMTPPPPADLPKNTTDETARAMPKRLAFLSIDETDRQRLHAVAGQLNERAAEFVETFYRHLFAFEETARFLQDPVLVERLKSASGRISNRCCPPIGARTTRIDVFASATSTPKWGSTRRSSWAPTTNICSSVSVIWRPSLTCRRGVRRTGVVAAKGGIPGYWPDPGGVLRTEYPKSTASVGFALPGQQRSAPIRAVDVARFEDATSHDGQSVRRGA